MTAKEYLSQAFHLDVLIKAKLEQVKSFYIGSIYASPVISDMPGSSTPDIHKLDSAVASYMDFMNEIKAEAERLIQLKHDIIFAISQVDDYTYRTVLELRYIQRLGWDDIAKQMGYNVRHVYRLHKKALLKVGSKCD